MLRPNRLKRRIAAGQGSLGCWLFAGSVAAAEILAGCGFDALLIDHEHSPGGMDTSVAQLRAGAAGQATMLVRIADNGAAPVKRMLDLGAEGIVAANVEQVAEIEAVVRAAYYPPVGARGAHFTVSRAAGWGADVAAYPAHAASETLVIAMIESAAGVAAIPELSRVGNVDMFFIGPLDLSASIGRMGEYASREFTELLAEAERRIGETNAALGGAAMPDHDGAALFARGYRLVTAASDVGLLRGGALEAVREIHGETRDA